MSLKNYNLNGIDIPSFPADPLETAINGRIYFNRTTEKVRIYVDGAWGDLVAAETGVSTLNTLDGDIVLAAGSGITITPSGNTLTIDSSGGGSFDPSAINTGLIPDSDSAYDIGATGQAFSSLYIYGINDSSGTNAIDVVDRILYDNTNIPVLDWQNRVLSGAGGGQALKFVDENNVQLGQNLISQTPGSSGLGNTQDGYLGQVSTINLTIIDNITSPFASSPNNIVISAPALAAGYGLVLPVDAGTNGQLLSTDGSGNTSWKTVASAPDTAIVNVTTLDADGTNNTPLDTPINLKFRNVNGIVQMYTDATMTFSPTGTHIQGFSAVVPADMRPELIINSVLGGFVNSSTNGLLMSNIWPDGKIVFQLLASIASGPSGFPAADYDIEPFTISWTTTVS